MEFMFSSIVVNLIGNLFCKDLKREFYKIYLFFYPLTNMDLTKKNAVYKFPSVKFKFAGAAAVVFEG
jgi:hypothetical protein